MSRTTAGGGAWRRLVLLLSLISIPGCVAYSPAQFDTVPEGGGVRIFLSREEMLALEDQGVPQDFFVGTAPVLEGTVVRREQGRLFVRIPVASRQVGFLNEELGQILPVRSNGIVQIERRQLSRGRTGLALIGTAALAASMVYLILDGARQPNDPSVPDPDNARIPLISVPIR